MYDIPQAIYFDVIEIYINSTPDKKIVTLSCMVTAGSQEVDTEWITNIFLVDDDEDDRDLFKEAAIFVNPKVNITGFKQCSDFMEKKFLPTIPEILFLDLNLPKIDGRSCLKEIRKDPDLKSIPIIIYTTTANPRDVEDTFSGGATFYLKKATSFSSLISALKIILSKKIILSRPSDVKKYQLDLHLESFYEGYTEST